MIYEAGRNHEGTDYVCGPGEGLGHYSQLLYPGLACKNKDEAERAAAIANIAYASGYEKAQYDTRRSMGIRGGMK